MTEMRVLPSARDRFHRGGARAMLLVVAALVGAVGAISPVGASAPVSRIASNDRIGTAIEISGVAYPGARTAGGVVLAAATDFPDALAGAPLAAAKNAPVLLTASDTLSASTLIEIQRVARSG